MNPDENVMLLDELIAYGHPNVLSNHRTTIEFTRESFLTTQGDCILGVKASKACKDLTPQLRSAIQQGQSIKVELTAGTYHDFFIGVGSGDLTLNDTISMVFRTSTFISDRTILLRCSKAAKDINRQLVEYLQDPNHQVIIQFCLAK